MRATVAQQDWAPGSTAYPGRMDARLRVVKATPGDSADIFAWRNDEATRVASISQALVAPAEHDRWYSRVLADPDRVLYVVWTSGERVGLCRFDRDGSFAEVSINLNPAFRGRGLAEPVLRASIERYREDSGRGIALTATIRPENIASQRIFAALGFVLGSRDDTFEHFVLAPLISSSADPS